MYSMVYGIATRGWDGAVACIDSWSVNASRAYPYCYALDMEVMPALQYVYENTTEPIIAYIHDDLRIDESNWDVRVLKEFEDPKVGLVGFAGALGHGTSRLYNEPFHIPNLVRVDFISNLRNAEDHGYRFAGESTVAVLDGLALFVRRTVLDKWGGWPVDSPLGYWMYSEALCCETRRQGMKIRMVGVACDHLSGKTASMVQVKESYEEAHRFFADTNRDVLPYYVEAS